MAYRIFYACDIVGCKITSDKIERSGNTLRNLPEGWLPLRRMVEFANDFQEDPILICPEHSKLFPPIPRKGGTQIE